MSTNGSSTNGSAANNTTLKRAYRGGVFDLVPRLGYREYWHPGILDKDVGRKPVSLKILGDDLVFFRDGDGTQWAYRLPVKRSIFATSLTAFVAAFAGVGGGLIYTPLTTRVMRMPFRLAVPVSHVVITGTRREGPASA